MAVVRAWQSNIVALCAQGADATCPRTTRQFSHAWPRHVSNIEVACTEEVQVREDKFWQCEIEMEGARCGAAFGARKALVTH
eukprot:52905-Lingulodinium_polyedra.AAC.1